MKKEYYLPLAIIIGTIIIGLSIYLSVTAEYRAKKSMCEKFLPKDVEKDLFYEMSLLGCIKKQSK